MYQQMVSFIINNIQNVMSLSYTPSSLIYMIYAFISIFTKLHQGAMIISGMKKFQFALNVLYREDGMPQSYLTRKPKIRLNGRDLLGTLINKQQREKERLQMLENRKREERDMAMMADEYDDDRSASSNSLGLNRHHRNRSMENRFAAMSAVMDVRKNEDIINHQEQFYEPEILKEEVDRRPPPSTPQVPSSRNRNVSGKDRSYRGLLQKKQLRKKRAVSPLPDLFIFINNKLTSSLISSSFRKNKNNARRQHIATIVI
jgi:hypothetical protein